MVLINDIIDGIECRAVTSPTANTGRNTRLYATIPLDWLRGLTGESGKVIVISLLWCLGGMAKGEWFKFGNNICNRYGVTPSQKNKILSVLESTGHIKLKRAPGKTTMVKIVKPAGWG